MTRPEILRLGTRGSLLARTQSGQVAEALMRLHPGLRVELVLIQTTGDRVTDRPLAESGGKGLFTKEIELALISGQIDFAVHSYKDVPVTQPLVDVAPLVVAAVPVREDPRDVLVAADPGADRGGPLHRSVPRGARIGTSSLRRAAQLRAIDRDVRIEPLRGNIDTRLRKLREGQYDAIVLAAAGLRRAGLFDASSMVPLEPEVLLPAAGQGALALQCRRDDTATLQRLHAIDDPGTRKSVDAEREVVRRLGGDCHSPIAALAEGSIAAGQIALRARVAARGGGLPVISADAQGPAGDAVDQAVARLEALGAASLLHTVR